MPKVEFRYEDSGAQGVKANLQTTEQVAHKLSTEIQALNKKAQLEEARKGTKEYQAALERLAQAQGKVAQQSAGVQQKLEGIKKAMGIGALNAAREMTAAVSNLVRGFYDMGKAGATTEEQRKRFEQTDLAVERLESSVSRLAAKMISESGVITKSIGAIADAFDWLGDTLSDQTTFLGKYVKGIEDGLDMWRSALPGVEEGTIDVTAALRDEYFQMKNVKDKADELAAAMGKLTLQNRTYAGVTGTMTAVHENNIHTFIKGGAHYGKAAELLEGLTKTTKEHGKRAVEASENWANATQPLLDMLYRVDDVVESIANRTSAMDPEALRQIGLVGQGQFAVSEVPELPGSQADAYLAEQERQASEVFSALKTAMDPVTQSAAWMNDEFGKTGAVLGAIGQQIPGLTKAFIKAEDAWGAFDATIAAGRAVSLAFIDDKATQAMFLGFWEQAEAIAAFARLDIAGGIGHQAAAVAYWAVSAKGGRGGGGGAAAGAATPPPTSGTMGPDPFRTQDASPRESTNIYIETIDPGKAGESVLDAVEQYGRRGGARKISTNLMGTNQGSQEF